MTDTLTVIDSYLSLDSTQYAQAPIGATRLATKGNGTGVRGTVPAWSATSWEIEFDIVFPTTFYDVSNKIIDGANGTARPYITITTAGKFERDAAVILGIIIDGAAVTFGVTTHPVDGGVHHVKLTAAGPTIFGTVLGRYAYGAWGWEYCTASIFNLRLTDLSNSANSRFYPMDETIATATFLDTSANAAHGTWFNRVAGDVVTVYPGAIKPGEEFWIACKFRLPVTTATMLPLSIGSFVAGGSSVVFQVYLERIYCTRYNGTATSLNSAIYMGPIAADTEYTVVTKIAANGAISLYVNSLANLVTGAAAAAHTTAMTWLNINGTKTTDGASASRGVEDVYYAYLYSGTPSNAEIEAIMAGENPEYVGVIKQGYNLAGNGDEVNGGPALTLYGAFDGEQWYVPSFVTHRGARKVVSSPVRSPIRSVVRSPIN